MSEVKYKLARLVDCKGDMSGEWYVVFYLWDNDKGKLVRKRDYTINAHQKKKDRIAAASQLIQKINSLLQNGAYGSKTDSMNDMVSEDFSASTFLNAIKSFIQNKKLSLRKNSMKGFGTVQFHVEKYLSETGNSTIRLSDITPAMVHNYFDYLKSKGLSNRTINNQRGNLSTIFNYYKGREEIKKNPVTVKKIKAAAAKHKPFSDEQMKLIKADLEKNDQQLLLFIQFIYYTFLRPGEELRLLRIEDIKEKTIQVPGSISKNLLGEHVVIPIALEKIIQEKKLRSYPPEYFVFTKDGIPGPINAGMKFFYKRNAQLLKRLKLDGKDFDLYGYKHTGTIKLYNSCKDIKAIQRQCRHSTIQQTDAYLRGLGLIANEQALNFPEF